MLAFKEYIMTIILFKIQLNNIFTLYMFFSTINFIVYLNLMQLHYHLFIA